MAWTELPWASNPSLGGLWAARVASAALWAPLIPRRRLGGYLCLGPPIHQSVGWPSRLRVGSRLLLGFRLLPCQTSQILCFPSAKTALGCLAGSRERQQNTELEPPNLELCCSRALRPSETATAGAEGGGPALVSHRQGPVTPSGCPARTSRLAPDARVQKQGAPSTPLPRPTSLRAACVTSHMEDGGWRLEVGGWRLGCWVPLFRIKCMFCFALTAFPAFPARLDRMSSRNLHPKHGCYRCALDGLHRLGDRHACS